MGPFYEESDAAHLHLFECRWAALVITGHGQGHRRCRGDSERGDAPGHLAGHVQRTLTGDEDVYMGRGFQQYLRQRSHPTGQLLAVVQDQQQAPVG